ncbi:energy transducer TonB [Spirosoma sp.]|uniref:energy transducer TonB n=1 Tax=Spirosoma sp. TaxID=1899569 RepID=UPI002610909B|nr:energy transducer TonB [Spirosoma sp.]MCX6213085.1 energy transducer TonB [Spirosoma sp.]
MIPQRSNRSASNAGLMLTTMMLLIGITMACSQRSQTTQSSQTVSQPFVTEEIFTVCEVPPSFPGGNALIRDYLRQNLRYPEAAIKAKVQGRVFVSFLVTKDGTIRDVTILKGYSHGINDEAIRLTQAMPTWIPGKQAGHAVNVTYNLVIPFELASLK